MAKKLDQKVNWSSLLLTHVPFLLVTSTYHLPRPQKATALAVDECLYGRDVVPLSPAVREANLRNQVAPRDFPPEDKSARGWQARGAPHK